MSETRSRTRRKRRREERLGRCFSESGQWFLDAQTCADGAMRERPDLRLCHGTCRLSVEPHCLFAHAWVEIECGGYYFVKDYAAVGLIDRDAYYVLGQATDVRRYTLAEVRERIAATGHWGPWHELEPGVR